MINKIFKSIAVRFNEKYNNEKRNSLGKTKEKISCWFNTKLKLFISDLRNILNFCCVKESINKFLQ